MGEVIYLSEWPSAREESPGSVQPMSRLDSAVAELERILGSLTRHPSAKRTAEAGIASITDAVAHGKVRDAAERAEVLVRRLKALRPTGLNAAPGSES